MSKEYVLQQNELYKGKIEVKVKVPLKTQADLSTFYSPGIALPCLEIQKDVENIYKYTNKGNTIAVISDGSAILGLGNIGPKAGLPVMEAKAAVLKQFANIDAFPICLNTNKASEIIQFCKLIEPSVSAIMLEDIAAPQCVEVERALSEQLNIPVFHDDQHGTSIVVCAALLNALKIVQKDIANINVVVCGTGAAGSAIIKLLHILGVKNIVAYNIKGVVSKQNPNYNTYNFLSLELMELLNKNYIYNKGTLEEAITNADVFIGVSVGNILTADMIKSMNKDAIVFALANPNPEIDPNIALNAGAKIVGTGRSDFNNQINNILAFPGLFKGLLKAKAKKITLDNKITAIYSIANMVSHKDLNSNYILPNILSSNVVEEVCNGVYNNYIKTSKL